MKHRKFLQAAVIAVSLALIGLGVQRGEMDVVLRKAVNLCLECIGIG